MGSRAREHSNFDLKFETNTKTYLTQCLAFAHAIIINFIYVEEKLKMKCRYQAAPVKLSDRCVVKATSDYGKREYASCASILDFMRFSVTFDNVNDLLNGLNQFISDINKGDVISCLVPTGFMKQLFWKPNIVLSIIVEKKGQVGTDFYPLFTSVCHEFSGNPKLVLFFLNCLFFYSFVMCTRPK